MTGGELYVPRIPSMKVIHLAKAITSGAPHVEVGIPSGEKFYEQMNSTEGARRILLQDGRYVVLAALAKCRFADPEGGQVPDGFSCSSNTNDLRLSVDGIRELIEQLEL